MATTTATLTLSSADLTGDALSLSTTSTLTKAGTLTGLDQTTGVGRKTTESSSLYNLFEGASYTAIGDSGGTPEEIGRLYAGDWMLMPWSAHDAANDICVTPSVSTALTVEYALLFEA
mgnify:CR=1 FL=1